MEEDPTTQELRIEQLRREEGERERADDATDQHEARASTAEYLRQKLEQRADAERRAGNKNDEG